MSAEPVTNGAEALVERLRSAILAGDVSPRSGYTEAYVGLRFSVARPTARLAIDRLVAEGLLQREPHRAARVIELDRADIVDLFDSRSLIEVAALRSLASSGTLPAEALSAHRALLRGGPDGALARNDIAFHRSLVSAQNSPRLRRMHALIMGEVELCIAQVHAHHLMATQDVGAQHRGILDAVTSGNADLAGSLTAAHIADSRDGLLAHFDSTSTSTALLLDSTTKG